MPQARDVLPKTIFVTVSLAMLAALCGARAARAQDVAPPPPPVQDVPPPAVQDVPPPPPPPVYIATVQPEYFEGRPVYWYNNSWYFRDEQGWHYYRHEPRELHERRANWDRRPRYRYHR